MSRLDNRVRQLEKSTASVQSIYADSEKSEALRAAILAKIDAAVNGTLEVGPVEDSPYRARIAAKLDVIARNS